MAQCSRSFTQPAWKRQRVGRGAVLSAKVGRTLVCDLREEARSGACTVTPSGTTHVVGTAVGPKIRDVAAEMPSEAGLQTAHIHTGSLVVPGWLQSLPGRQ